nr:MAG: Putative binding domain, N-terminal [Bacteriophage sp.]
MATIPSYLSWVPKTGTGNQQITINSTTPYKGRTNRTTEISGKIVGKSNSVTVTVVETAAAEYITPDSLSISVAKGGETIHVTGKSNSNILTFTWKTNFGIANVTSFKVNGSTTATSGTAITGDPGATGEYTYDVTVVVPKNETIKVRSAVLEIKGKGSTVVKTITITQAIGDSYLYLNSQGTTTATVTIPKGGGEQTLKVLSNDEWTFEPVE